MMKEPILRRYMSVLVFAGGALWPSSAMAHLRVSDSALFSGIIQPFTHVEGTILLLVLSLWAGCAVRSRVILLRFCLGGLAGGMLLGGMLAPDAMAKMSLAVVILTLGMGLAVAADRPGPGKLAVILTPIAGFILGGFWREGLEFGVKTTLFFMLGLAVSATALAAVVMAAAFFARGRVARIGVRILASWACAVSAMLLAYWYRSGPY